MLELCGAAGGEVEGDSPPDAAGLGWQEVEQAEPGFRFRYPPDWRLESWEGAVGVGPVSMPEDVQWAVYYYPLPEGELEDLIAAMGSQFTPDRVEMRRCVRLPAGTALEVTVTTSRLDSWVYVAYFVEAGQVIYQIGNGAIPDDRFSTFVHSFEPAP